METVALMETDCEKTRKLQYDDNEYVRALDRQSATVNDKNKKLKTKNKLATELAQKINGQHIR